MKRENDHWAMAGLLIGRYGDAAATVAQARENAAADKGETDEARIWRDVGIAIVRETYHADG